MLRRTHALFVAALLLGLLAALGVAACGSSSQSSSALEKPPLTVDTGATLPDAAATTASTATTTTTATTGSATATGSGGAVATGGGTSAGAGTSSPTGGGTAAGGGAPSGGGSTTTPTTQPSNPGGASPNYKSFCDQNPGAC